MEAAAAAATLPQRLVQVYGLRIESDWTLDSAPTSTGTPDIRIRQAAPESILQVDDRNALRPYESSPLSYTPLLDGGALVSWDGLFRFVVSSDGANIAGCADAALGPDALRAHLFGPVVSFALLRLGFEPLHGTALTVHGSALALLGDSGVGKSTLAAALIAEGARLLTDDLLVVEYKNDVPMAQPGLQRLKLMPDAAQRWNADGVGTPFHPGSPKHVFTLNSGMFAPEAARLHCCFVLQRADTSPACEQLPPNEAMHQLAANAFNTLDTRPERLRNHFLTCAELARRVAVYRLELSDRLDEVPQAAQLVRATLESALRSKRSWRVR